MTTGLREEVTEKQVTAAWQSLLNTDCKLKTEKGQSLRVIYPGKSSDAPGSDFQDAVIQVNRHVLKGNIELHVKSSDWHKHEHDRNPIYNGVVLHVALYHDYDGDIKTQNGDVIPAVAISRYLGNNLAAVIVRQMPCAGAGANSPDSLLAIIDNAGLVRFHEKAARFQNYLQREDAGQCLYCGLMEALGYSHNKEPFRQLAEKVPLSVLESIVWENSWDETTLALLMGTAGLLPSQKPQVEYSPLEDYTYVNELEKVWEGLNHLDVMDYADWQPFRVRPSNSPLRRIAGICQLLRRYQAKGLLAGLVELVGTVLAERASHYLEAGLMVADDGYWSNRYDFGKGYPGLSKWLIGQSRAADIVINVLLPFVYVWGKDNGQKEMAEKALAIFRAYPAGETNILERHMSVQFGLKSKNINLAQRQQGLLHLYKKWCTQGRCKECEVVRRGEVEIPNTKKQIPNNETRSNKQESSIKCRMILKM